MLVQTQPTMTWLRRQRREVELELGLMASQFDLDGALAAGQLGLAWMTRYSLLYTAVDLHLRRRGVECEPLADDADQVCRLMDCLDRLDPALGAEVWLRLEERCPDTEQETRLAVADATRFIAETLGVREAASREAAVRAWADAIRLLREVAHGMGLAQSDDWYLHEDSSASQLDWYDEVMGALARGAD